MQLRHQSTAEVIKNCSSPGCHDTSVGTLHQPAVWLWTTNRRRARNLRNKYAKSEPILARH